MRMVLIVYPAYEHGTLLKHCWSIYYTGNGITPFWTLDVTHRFWQPIWESYLPSPRVHSPTLLSLFSFRLCMHTWYHGVMSTVLWCSVNICAGKTSLEGKNSSSLCYVTFLVYFLTMASQTGCDIMNNEVAGSTLAVFAVRWEGFSDVRKNL